MKQQATPPIKQALAEPAYTVSVEETLKQLTSDLHAGLPDQEVQQRIARYGANELQTSKPESIWKILLRQFNSLIVWVLAFAAGVSFFTGDIPEGYAILGVILINALMGFVLELRARQSMNALKSLDKTFTRVIRNGKLQEVTSEEITIGDILFVEAGDVVPADARIAEASQLETDEAALTGESLPVSKQTGTLPAETPIAEQTNLLFKGTAVVKGNSKAIVTAVGLQTELGKITSMVQSAEQSATPLEKKLESLTKRLIWITLVLAGIYVVAGLIQNKEITLLFKTSIALAVAAIPEGLSIVATIVLAAGMLRMAKRNVIVKRLAAVETLGGTNVIFTDKTGTLTYNKIQVNTICLHKQQVEVQADHQQHQTQAVKGEASLLQTESYQWLIKAGVLCNNADIQWQGEEIKEIGDPVEVSLLLFGESNQVTKHELEKEFQRLEEEAFSSETRMMGTLHQAGNEYHIMAKGAAEELLKKCTSVLHNEGVQPLSEEDRTYWFNKSESLSAEGLRVLAFAYKTVSNKPSGYFMEGLTLIGLIGFLDPPRTEVRQAMQDCKEAGIKVIMVTGDHPATALTISHKVNLTEETDTRVINGKNIKDLQTLTSEEKDKLLDSHVFARVSPAQKLDLISLYQQQDNIVGMTGDGINDAPALKKADIGIAMGLRGTQVARETADIVLKDDAFHSIVAAIRQGRIIFENIREFVVYLLSCNLSEILVVTAFGFLTIAASLTPLQILFLNLVTDVFPALALGMGTGNPYLMKRPPRHPKEPIVNNRDWIAIGVYSVVITLCVVGAAIYGHYSGISPETDNNLIFYSLALAQLFHVFNMSPGRVSFFNNEITRNPYVWGALVLCIGILLLTYYVGFLKDILSIQTITSMDLAIIAVAGILPVFLVRLLKMLRLVN